MDRHKQFLIEYFDLPKNKIKPLSGGWRKKSFLVELESPKVVCFIKKDFPLKKIKAAVELEEKFGGRKLTNLEKHDDFWLLIFSYIPGKIFWTWDRDQAYQVGEKLAELHQAGVAHFDLKPGNVIWDENGIKAVIDFEEALYLTNQNRGQAICKIKDLANTLSWVLVSGGHRQSFLDGYVADEEEVNYDQVKLDYDKLEKYLLKYLTMRADEGNKQAFLQLAKKKLKAYQDGIENKMVASEDLAELRQKYDDKKIVFVIGAFELIHHGHFLYLKSAADQGDLLVLGVASNQSRQRLKGSPYPLIDAKTRAETMAHFSLVDKVVVVDEEDIIEELSQLKPDVFYTVRKDWKDGVRKKKERELVKSYGGKIIKAEYEGPKMSSSQLILNVAQKKIRHLLKFLDEDDLLRPLLNGSLDDSQDEEQLDLFK